MQVNFQYAEEHLADLASAVDSGHEVEISRPDKPTLKLVATGHSVLVRVDRTGSFGAGKGTIWMADDWDSDETNEEIARLFNEGPVFPDEN
ncbi:MAG: type II toxin-antitoxin system Phd/YefM family antitoxin [Acidobacteriaceae bacterium]